MFLCAFLFYSIDAIQTNMTPTAYKSAAAVYFRQDENPVETKKSTKKQQQNTSLPVFVWVYVCLSKIKIENKN